MADDTQQLLIRMRLIGGAATKSELLSTAGAVTAFGDASELAGKKTAFAAEKAFLFGEGMYSLRRYAFYGLTAIGATGIGILKMGYDFDEARSRGVDALTAITGGAANARIEVSKLIDLTHTSGLGLESLVTGTQNMLNFGFSVAQTNQYLAAFANFAGVKGLGSAGVTTLTELFNRVKSTGVLSSRQVNSLVGLGVPANKLLQQGLGLTPAQMFAFTHGQLQIPSSVALPQIAAWLQKYAASQPKSLGQYLAIGHGYLSQIAGTIGTPAFSWLDKELASVTARGGLLSRLTAAGNKGGGDGMLKALDPSGTLLHGWQTLANGIRITADAAKNLWTVAKPVVAILALMSSVLLGVTAHSTALKAILEPLIALYIVSRTQLLLLWAAEKAVAVIIGIARGAFILYTVALKGAVAAQWLLNIAMDANPIALIVIGVAALSIGLYELYTRVAWFRQNWPFVASFIAGPFFLAGTAILTHLQTIWNFLKSIYNWLDHHVFNIVFHVPGSGLLSAIEHPLRTAEHVGSLAVRSLPPIHVHMHVDGKEMAVAVAKHPKIIGDAAAQGKQQVQARR